MPGPADEEVEVRGFEFDDRNISHFRHGLAVDTIWEVWAAEFRVFVNPATAGRTGTHLMIGPDFTGRVWTIVMLEVETGIWRPITGWPSTGQEELSWRGA